MVLKKGKTHVKRYRNTRCDNGLMLSRAVWLQVGAGVYTLA